MAVPCLVSTQLRDQFGDVTVTSSQQIHQIHRRTLLEATWELRQGEKAEFRHLQYRKYQSQIQRHKVSIFDQQSLESVEFGVSVSKKGCYLSPVIQVGVNKIGSRKQGDSGFEGVVENERKRSFPLPSYVRTPS